MSPLSTLPPVTVPKLLFSRKEAAATLAISIRNLDSRIAAKELPIRKFGSRILISHDALLSFASRDHAPMGSLA